MIKHPTSFLLVEDDEIDAERLKRAFKKLDINDELVHVKDGLEALNALRGTGDEPKLRGRVIILLDLNMPRLNGFEFLEEIRKDEELKHAPIFVMTTSDREEDIEAAYKKNIAGYVVKPLGMDATIEAISTLSTFWDLNELPKI